MFDLIFTGLIFSHFISLWAKINHMADEVKMKLFFFCLVEFLELVTCFEQVGVLLSWHLKLRWPCMCKSIYIFARKKWQNRHALFHKSFILQFPFFLMALRGAHRLQITKGEPSLPSPASSRVAFKCSRCNSNCPLHLVINRKHH